jgi:glycosyltransferase involved in cell wall biosynthesis
MSEHAEPLEVSVVLPCLNEAQTVAVCVRKALDTLHRLGLRGEVVVTPVTTGVERA